MKNKNTFIFKGLISMVLSLVLVFGTAGSSLSAVTDSSVAAVTEPVRSAIPDAPAPAQAIDETELSTQSASSMADYGVAEGSMLELPADDDVLDVDLQSSENSQVKLTLNRKADHNLASTGAAVTSGSLDTSKIYYLGADSGAYRLIYESGWKVKRTSDGKYYNLAYSSSSFTTSESWNDSGTTSYSVSDAGAQGITLSCSVNERGAQKTYYLSYSAGTINYTNSNRNAPHITIYEAAVTYTVTFNKNDGTETTTTQNNIAANTATALTANTFTRGGYTFTGWNTAADGSGSSYADGASVTLSANLSLYAQWTMVAVASTEAPTEAPATGTVTLYFTNSQGWDDGKICVYLWNEASKSTGTTIENKAWPGQGILEDGVGKSIGQNDYNQNIYAVTVDTSLYDHIIFLENTKQTVDIDVADVLANGAGVYCLYSQDSSGHNYINCYTYNNQSSTGDPNTITYKKQIEKLNPSNADDYNYRLHLNVDGSALKDSTTHTTEGSATGIVLLIQISDDVNATSFSQGKSKLDVINEIVNDYLNECKTTGNKMSVVLVTSNNYDHYNDLTTVKSDWNSNEQVSLVSSSTFGGNLTAGLMKATDLLKTAYTDKKAVVYITVKDPQFTSDPSTGLTDRTNVGKVKQPTVDYVDTFLNANEGVNLYTLDVANEGGAAHDIPKAMGEEAESKGRGKYYLAAGADALREQFNTIIETIDPADKTSNLTVTDTLSKYVDFASEKNLTATLYTGYNSSTQTWSKSTNYTESSPELTVSGDTVTFSRANEIEGPFKLEIAFDIKTADGVLRDTDTYGSSGYPNAGDADTDFTTATSAEKPGYYANSSATISYTLNGTSTRGTFIKPVVQAPAETPVQGKYIFLYTDRFGDNQKVTVPVMLNRSEKKGYSGNGNQAGVPTFLWTDDAKTLYNDINPLVTAALALEGNEETGDNNWQKDASVYKCDIVWENLTATSRGSNVSYNTTEHSVTIKAITTPYKFKLLYYTVNGSTVAPQGTASELEYGKAVTFNPIYAGSSKYAYVKYTVPSDGFSYWSADPEGDIPITTNLTYGMIMRGDYMHDDDNDRTVHIYAQYNKTPKALWNPLIEEAKLTHTIDDDHDWVYLDYMTNYLSKDGTVVQKMEVKPEYGIVVAKYSSEMTTLDQTKMQSVADAMITGKKSSAYLNSEKTAIAYRFHYSDAEHISDFNRTLYTLKSNTSAAENMQFTAIAYIVVENTTYYSPINTDITVIDLSDN